MVNGYWVVPAKLRLIITVSVVLLVVVLVIVGVVTKAQASQSYVQVILNLLNGQQYFGVPHVYQGVNYYGLPTSQWPVYLGPSNASKYWLRGSITSDQPVLELVPAYYGEGGAMFWSETYSGGVVKITIIGTYTAMFPCPLIGDGFVIYLFLKPTRWGVSPARNYSISYTRSSELSYAPSPVSGVVILPQSSTPYIVVQWDPDWQVGYWRPGATGQWNVWIVSNPNGTNPIVAPSPSPNLDHEYAGWGGIGTGAFLPIPGDWINITVTYNSSTNMLSGVAVDLNHTGWVEANFTVNLNGYWTPLGSGSYVFGVGAATGYDNANWALLYVALMGNVKPSPSTTSTTTPAIITVTTTSIVTSTVTSPVTTTVTSTTTFTVTTTSPVTVTTTVFTTPSIIQTMIIALVIIIMVLAAALVAVMIRRR